MLRSAPSPGTPGEGWGEGDLERRVPLVLEITLILSFSRSTGRRDQRPFATNRNYTPSNDVPRTSPDAGGKEIQQELIGWGGRRA